MKPSLLLIDDELSILRGMGRFLTGAGYLVEEAACLADARVALCSTEFDAVLLDLNLPDGNGLNWIPEVRANYPELAIVVISGEGDIPMVVEAMRLGADNFLTKPIKMRDLDIFLRKSLELGSLRKNQRTQERMAQKSEPYFGQSPQIQNIRELVSIASDGDATVLLQGETGSGKGILARWIHEQSGDRLAPFVELNCSSLRGELLASELFGHARGAFTTALQDREGLLEVADGGTLFLDEIGDMDLRVQAQFLKVIEEKQYRRLGEVKVRRSSFRLLCATNRNLRAAVEDGTFRKDLFFRIHVFPISLPPLRERTEDIPGLSRHILESLGGNIEYLTPEILEMLQSYAWPGNIRELRNVLERALLISRRGPLDVHRHFPGMLVEPRGGGGTLNLEKAEASHIRDVMQQFDGNTNQVAQALGISRATLYRKLKKMRADSNGSGAGA